MGKPHKHSELIKLWADGAEIEYLHIGKESNEWQPIFEGWSWDSKFAIQYRIKPEPKPDEVRYATVLSVDCYKHTQKDDHNLKMIFDGETGELKSAEVLK